MANKRIMLGIRAVPDRRQPRRPTVADNDWIDDLIDEKYKLEAEVSRQYDEIERLRVALALACGLLSTYEDHSMFHPEALVLQFMEEARRG